MLTWISDNAGTIVVLAILAVIVAAIIWKLISDKRKGFSSCGGNCAHCKMCAGCRKKTP
ncbi:MAG: FeoB-associated Cys-rich membrane protein [Lachnospiraceae bacterium]|nr:FeoB-associated Cys-rich membrane protein [Lachnospiraceae bacterium]